MDRSQVVVVDTETTGLEPARHEIWEVCAAWWGYAEDDGQPSWVFKTWQLPVDLGRADPVALRVGQFHERRETRYNAIKTDYIPGDIKRSFAAEFAGLTRGKHMLGAVPSFDEGFLKKLLQENGQCWEVHYHLIDIEALVMGSLYGIERMRNPRDAFPEQDAVRGVLPWKSSALAGAIGVNSEDFAQHTAEGDVRWTIAQLEIILNG